MYFTRLQVVCDPDFSEILMAEIADIGFDTFMETDKGFEAYAEEKNFVPSQLEEIQSRYAHVNPLLVLVDKVEKQNWNEEWEKNVEPIFVDDQILVRSSFHQIDRAFPYEIVITPKMSFGTGHHQTTYLMLRNQLRFDHKNKRVMDAGCGTAILSIMAAKLGAREVEAFDIDEWSVTNGNENAEVNRVAVHIQQGKLDQLFFDSPFDIILANINKNVLLAEMHLYAEHLIPEGFLLLSGFYTRDIDDLMLAALPLGLREVHRDERETWAALLLQKVR
ncbi:MAG: 50S ribosomal protein L11 methyltransferase [Bacteroidota bacterium]